MANYKTAHPWNPGYAIPDYIRAEPPGRAGAITTLQLPRGTMSDIPPGLSYGGFALPDYVRREPIGRGAAATYQMRRKTIPTYLPDAIGASDKQADAPKTGIPMWAIHVALGAAILIALKACK